MRAVIVDVDPVTMVATKRAETAVDATRLRREARILDAARHPGLTEALAPIAGAEPEVALQLRVVAGRTLSLIDSLADGEIAGLGAAIATTVADLHDLGIVHGALTADHVIVEPSGCPIICSLGRGSAGRETSAGPVPPDDVASLATMLLDRLAPGPRPRGRDGLRRTLAVATRRDPRRRPSARALALQLSSVPGAALPDSSQKGSKAPGVGTGAAPPQASPAHGGIGSGAALARLAGPGAAPLQTRPDGSGPAHASVGPGAAAPQGRPERSHPARRLRIVAAAAAVVSAAGFLVVRSARPDQTIRCPAADEGCRPVPHPAGIVTTGGDRYAIGPPGDPVVIGRWHCRTPLPALLQPATGQVWVFDSLALPGATTRGRLVVRVEGALSLRVEPLRSGCDRLLVIRRAGRPVGIDPNAPAPWATTGTSGAERTD